MCRTVLRELPAWRVVIGNLVNRTAEQDRVFRSCPLRGGEDFRRSLHALSINLRAMREHAGN
jgi:hypothetical protein